MLTLPTGSIFVFDPDDTSTTWQDTAATIAAIVDTDPIRRADNANGNSNELYSGTDASRPILKANIVGTNNVARFDGVDDNMAGDADIQTAWNAAVVGPSKSFGIYLAIDAVPSTGTFHLLSAYWPAGDNHQLVYSVVQGKIRLLIYGTLTASVHQIWESTAVHVAGSPTVISIAVTNDASGIPSVDGMYVNSVSVAYGLTITGTLTATPSTTARLSISSFSSDVGVNVDAYASDVGFAAVYPDTNEINAINTYLSDRFGLLTTTQINGAATVHSAGQLDYTASGTTALSGGETVHTASKLDTAIVTPLSSSSTVHLAGQLDYTASGTTILNGAATVHTASELDPLAYTEMSEASSTHVASVIGHTTGAVGILAPRLTSTSTLNDASFYINPSTAIPSTTIYRLTLTGGPDSVTDIDLPISNVQSRLRVGVNYLSATVPNVQQYADEIALRPNGQLVLKRGAKFQDGTEQLVEIGRVDYDRLTISQGSTSVSGTIMGNLTTTESTGKTISLASGSFFSSGTGSRRYTTTPDYNIKPGDTVVIPETSEIYIAGNISIQVAAGVENMTVTEVE